MIEMLTEVLMSKIIRWDILKNTSKKEQKFGGG